MFLRNIGCISTDYTVSYPIRQCFPLPMLWAPQIQHNYRVIPTWRMSSSKSVSLKRKHKKKPFGSNHTGIVYLLFSFGSL
jgi:hypothetical protein